MNPQFNSAGGSVDKPCFTLIARMDKMPPYLIEASREEIYLALLRCFQEDWYMRYTTQIPM